MSDEQCIRALPSKPASEGRSVGRHSRANRHDLFLGKSVLILHIRTKPARADPRTVVCFRKNESDASVTVPLTLLQTLQTGIKMILRHVMELRAAQRHS